jgi:oligoendopeptidase F
MKQVTVRTRAEIPFEYRWNAESVFATPADWQIEARRLPQALTALEKFKGRLGEGPDMLLEGLKTFEKLYVEIYKVYVYAFLSHEVDTADPGAAVMLGQGMGLYGQLNAQISYIDPEVISIGQETLERWLAETPSLQVYAHYVHNLFRRQAHVRSAEVEELVGMLAVPFGGAAQNAALMSDADFRFPAARASDGTELPVSQGTLHEILSGPDRAARQTAWESYTGAYLGFKNTLANNLVTSVQQNVFLSRVHRYPGTLEASLFANNIPVEVFHQLVETFKRNLPTWHRYWAVRRKALGVEKLQPYDIWAPLTDQHPTVPYLQAVEWICQALAPMGADYVEAVRKGCLEERWIDVYPNQGKSSAQFSSGGPGMKPIIFINYDDTIFSASTLAHELGHSMHTYLTCQNQPVVYNDYSLFAAEVASNFHQAMLRAHLLKTSTDPNLLISVIEEAMSNFHRYFFIMPTLARFELEVHQRAERGQGISAEDLNNLMADLFSEGYGSEVEVDRERVGITWATFGHLYMDYYVYQYATGISGANALSRRILAGEPGATERYLGFLKAGSSVYPLEALQQAGVDLSSPAPVEEAFAVLAGLVDRLEKLVEKR